MRVNCSGRGIVELDLNVVFATEEERNALAVVKHLDLSRNELRIVSNLQPFSCLATLELSHNRITALAGLPLGLVRLCVSHNELTTLDGLSTLPFLQELDVSHNRLSSLAGLPRTSPVSILKLSHNRLSNIHGIEAVMNTLQVVELDSNYLCVVEDLRPLARMKALQQLTIRDNPMVDNANYRSCVCQMVPTMLVLDGTAVAGAGAGEVKSALHHPPSIPLPKPEPDNTSSIHNTSSSATKSSSRPMSYESIRARAEVRRGDVVEDNRKLQTDIDELTRVLERERGDGDKGQRKVRALEQEVREVRRVLAEELNKLTQVRQENDTLRSDVETHKARADKIGRDYKYAREKAKNERQRRVEDLERAKVAHQAVVHSLRARLHEYHADGQGMTDSERGWREEAVIMQKHITHLERENADLTMSLSTHTNAHYSAVSSHKSPPQRRGNYPIFPKQGGPRPLPVEQQEEEDVYDDVSGGSSHMVDFASQLKDWLVSELNERGGQQSVRVSPQRRPITSPSTTATQQQRSASNNGMLDDVWARNESILSTSSMKRT